MALSAKEAARELGTDARTFRKFMRAITPKENQPGQGNRYSIEEKELKKLKKRFEEWSAPKAKAEPPAPNGQGTKKKGKKSKEVDVVDITEDAAEDLDIEEPTDEELMSLEDASDILDDDIFELD